MAGKTLRIATIAGDGTGPEVTAEALKVLAAVAKLEVVRRGDVRRAKLNYLRDRKGKSAKVREKREDQ